MAKRKPRLCLTMIVKNESKIIERCLDSVKGHIDYWVIVDTGSTDDTKELIQNSLSDIPGELHEREFVSFGHNRTESLELSYNKSKFVLLMDADLVFKVNDPNFKKNLSPKVDAYMINECDSIDQNGRCAGFNYRNRIIINNEKEWFFEGSTHEVIELKEKRDTACINLDDVWIHNMYDGGSKSDKYTRDIRLLTQDLKEDPDNDRAMFYLGESYFNLAHQEGIDITSEKTCSLLRDASFWYQKRVDAINTWDQEKYISLFKMAKINSLMNDSIDFLGFLKAYEFMPSRLEPIYQIVRFCRENELYYSGYLIGKMALTNITPLPKDALFVDGDVYSYQLIDETAICASWAGDNRTSESMIESILPIIEGYASEENVERIKDNLKICRNLLAENV